MIIRAGDKLHHRPTRQVLTFAYGDTVAGTFAAAGDMIGEGFLSDCDIVARCTDDEHVNLLAELQVSGSLQGRKSAYVEFLPPRRDQ